MQRTSSPHDHVFSSLTIPSALFIQPKYANLLNVGPIAAMVGQRNAARDGTPVVASPVASEAGVIKV